MPKTLTKLYNPQSDLKEEQAHKNETVHDFTKFVNCNEVMGYALLCQKHHVKHVQFFELLLFLLHEHRKKNGQHNTWLPSDYARTFENYGKILKFTG